MGSASAVLALMRNVAGAFGIAIFSTLLNNAIENNLLDLSANSVVNVHPREYCRRFLVSWNCMHRSFPTIRIFIVAAVLLFVAAALALLIDVKKTTDGKEITVEI